MSIPGEFSKSMITSTPADLSTQEAELIRISIQRFPEEAIYVYSFKQNRMIYADGWEEVLGYKDEEINMLEIVNITIPEYADNHGILQSLQTAPTDFSVKNPALGFSKTRPVA